MEEPAAQPEGGQPSAPRKKITKQLTGKRDDSALHSAARAGNVVVVKEILTGAGEAELKDLLFVAVHGVVKEFAYFLSWDFKDPFGAPV